MKRLFLFTSCILVGLTGRAQVRCHIEGVLNDMTKGTEIVISRAGDDLRVKDNAIHIQANNGRFEYDLEGSQMDMYTVFLLNEYLQGRWNYGSFLLEDGAKVNINYDGTGFNIHSDGQEMLKYQQMALEEDSLFGEPLRKLHGLIKAQFELSWDAGQNLGENEDIKRLMQEEKAMTDSLEHEGFFKRHQKWREDYMASHPIPYNLFYIGDKLAFTNEQGQDQLLSLYHQHYEDILPGHPVHQSIAMKEAAIRLKPGNPFINLQARTADGNIVDVSSLYQGKVTLICLWASWCGPCRRHNKAMIPVYEAYRDKGFTVIGIAHEKTLDSMIKAAEKDGYPWQNFVDLKDELHVFEKCGLSYSGGGMFLIDKDGIILSTSFDANELEPLIRKALGLE